MAVRARHLTAARSDPGRKRSNNEDRYILIPDRGIFGVIDGVGGQNAGEKAADTARDLIQDRLQRRVGDVEDRIREAITVANNEISQLATANSEWQGMACVLTLAVVEEGEITLGHVGDSRAYLIESGQIRKLTRDHSPVGEREDRGEIDEASAMRHPRRNEVYRDVGTEQHTPQDENFIEISTAAFPSNSALLLCSDGLSDLVSSAQIQALVEGNARDPEEGVRALIEAANEAGGKDNITVVLVLNDFRPASPPTGSRAPEMRRSQNPWPARALSLLLGVIFTIGAVFAFRPHWMDTPVVPPQTLRVTGEIGTVLATARPGDTVIVPRGVYNENVVLREGVRLVAEQPRQSVITASQTAVVAENLKSGTIEGFRILPSQGMQLQTGLRVVNSSVRVIDNEISGCVGAAVEFSGSSEGTLRANHIFSNPGSGVVLAGTASPRLSHNILNGNAKAGVLLQDAAQPSLTGNTFSRNGEDLSAPAQFNRDQLTRENYLTPVETIKPKPVRPRTGRR